MGDITFTFKQAGFFVLFTILGLLGIYLILALKNLIDTFKNINRVIIKNEDSIQKTISSLPIISKNMENISNNVDKNVKDISESVPNIINNVDDITSEVKGSVQKVGSTVDTVSKGVNETVVTISEGSKNAASYMKMATEIIKGVSKIFSKTK